MKDSLITLIISILFFSSCERAKNKESITESVKKAKDTVFIKYDKNGFDDTLTYKTDTVIYENANLRRILVGTTALPETNNQITAWEYGLDFYKVTSTTDCKIADKGNNQIDSILINDTSLIIYTRIYENCCFSFLCDIYIDSLSTLNLIYYGYGGICGCDCYSGLTYCLREIKNEDDLEEKKKIKAVMINGDPKTIKYLVK